MNPDSRMAISLVLSLLVSADNLRLAASGEADIVTVGVRYVVAFLLAFTVVGLIGRMVNGYVRAQHEDETPAPPVADRRSSDGTFGRRSQDRAPEADSKGGFDAPASESFQAEEAPPGAAPMRFLDHDSDAA